MMLDHDSPLVSPAAEPGVAVEAMPEALPRLSEAAAAPPPPPLPRIDLVFEQKGSLGIEFKELAAPFIIQQVHSSGLAFGKDLQKGDQLILVGGEDVTKLAWDDLVQKLGPRPVLVTFERPNAVEEEPEATSSFMSGLGSTMRSLGGSVMEQGFDLGKVGSALEIGTKGLEIGTKMGTAALGLGGMVGGQAPQNTNSEVENHETLAEVERLQLEVRRLQPFEEANKDLKAKLSEAERELQHHSQAHQSLNAESEGLRQKLAEVEHLQLEVRRLQPFEEVSKDLEARLKQAQLQLHQHDQAHQNLYEESAGLRQQLAEVDRLQLEVQRLQPFEEASKALEAQLTEAQSQLEQTSQAHQDHNAQSAELRRRLSAEVERLQLEVQRLQPLEEVSQQLDMKLKEAELKLQQRSQADQGLCAESEELRQRLAEVEHLQLEVQRLQPLEEANKDLEAKLKEAEMQREQQSQAQTSLNAQSEGLREKDAEVERLQLEVQRLQPLEEANKDLEAKLKEADWQLEQRSQAHQTLNAESEDLRQRLAEAESLRLEIQRLQPFEEASKELDVKLKEAQLQLEQHSQAHQNLNAESEGLRQRLAEAERMQLELQRLQPFEQAYKELEVRLTEAHLQLEQRSQAHQQVHMEAEGLRQRLAEVSQEFDTRLKEATLQLEQRSQALADLQRQRAGDAATIQQTHQSFSAESDGLRQRLVEAHQSVSQRLVEVENLQLEVRRLQPFEEVSRELEVRLKEAEMQIEQRNQALSEIQRQRSGDAATIQRLQGDLESIRDSGESQAGQLESALLERNSECATLRRERNEAHQKLQEMLQRNQENSQVADTGRTLSTENERLQQELAQSREELKSLNAVVERCLSKMEAESRERPFLVDKRMVTQMLAAYLEQRENPGPQQEILHKMADLLGFTSAEREQVGLSQKRKTPLQMQEPQGLADMADRFVDFLMEESEAG